MAESQDSAAMWQLKLHSSTFKCAQGGPFDPSLQPMVLRLLQDDDGLWRISSGLSKVHDCRECIAEFALTNGVIRLTTNVIGTSILPHAEFGLSLSPSFALDKSSDSLRTAVLLRPQDRIVFAQQSLEVSLEPANSGEAKPSNDAPDSHIEVNSSGIEDSRVIAGSDTESDDGDSLDKTKESQVTAAPFSTAHSTLPAVQETPKVQRSSTMAIDAQEDPVPPAPAVLTASRTALNRGRKRATREVEDSPSANENVSAPQKSKRQKLSSQSPVSQGSMASSRRQSGTPVASGTDTPARSFQLVFSGVEKPGKDVKSFLQRQKVTIAEELSTKTTHADKTIICCVGQGQLKTTAKVLMALANGHLVVTDDWIDKSVTAGRVLAPEDFVAKSLDMETDRSLVFKDCTVIFTRAAKKAYANAYNDITNILKAAGAENTMICAADKVSPLDSSNIIIGQDATDPDVVALLDRGERCFTRDLISSSIVQGKLLDDVESFGLFRGKETAPKKGKKKT